MQRQALEHGVVAHLGDYPAPTSARDLHERLSDVRCPTLVTVGADDAIDVRRIARELEAGIDGASLVTIDRAAHLPSLEQSGEFDRLLADFLRTLPPTG